MSTMALVDANNFFCSCELSFRPDLRGKPVVVLGSGDFIAIARSPEAKALGIKMASPRHQWAHLIQAQGVIEFSANFGLYTDFSERIRDILDEFTPLLCPYSIDESFLSFEGLENQDLVSFGKEIRQAVIKQVGVTCCVGIAQSKTLAKLANQAAKNFKGTGGVVDISKDRNKRKRMLEVMAVESVWGVGKATAKKLNELGIVNALQLAEFDPGRARESASINLSKTIAELNNEEIFPFETDVELNQQIIASRSLGHRTDDKDTLVASIAHHTSRAAKKLRDQKAVAQKITVNLYSGVWGSEDRYCPSQEQKLVVPSSNSSTLTAAAKKAIDRIYRPGFDYSKTGVVLSDIRPDAQTQNDLFATELSVCDVDEKEGLMDTMDEINERFGLGTLTVGSIKQGGDWQPLAASRSPAYISNWSALPIVKI